jgi:hypothetical protein
MSSSKQLSNTVSYSRLSTFTECPAKFYHRYVNKPEGLYVPLEDYFLKGTLAHNCVEEFLKTGGAKDDILEMLIPEWLVESCGFSTESIHMNTKDLDGLQFIDVDSLTKYAKVYGYLLHRASSVYKGTDAIRNADGSVPKDPAKFPPKRMSAEIERHGLYEIKMALDNLASLINPEFRRISLCNTAGLAAACFYNFYIPDWVEEITGIEYTSEKKISWDTDKEWAWFVDFSYKTKDGHTVISDHKTGKDTPSGLDVAFHSQLNMYAYLWTEDTGKPPDYIAINHLPSGEVVVAAVDLKVVYDTFTHFQDIQKAINLAHENNCWPTKMPTEYGTPCIKRDWKSKQVTSVCPYLQLCHPRYVDYVKDEVKHMLKLE